MAKIIDPDTLPYSNINISYSTKEIRINDTEDQKEQIKNDVLIINRNRQINSVLNNTPYEEMKIEDHKDYDHVFTPITMSQLYGYVQSILRTDEKTTPFQCETTSEIHLNNSFNI
tara:strand:- start:4329 stop:4673 length:345 start_codon:yes stop_codon:yes gene_type:complete